MIDDDTMLEPITLLQLMHTYNCSESWYIGDGVARYNAGGAGILLSKALLQALSAPWPDELVSFTFDEKGDPHVAEGVPLKHGGHKHSLSMLDWCIQR